MIFQFLDGAIKRTTTNAKSPVQATNFNSSMVRLKEISELIYDSLQNGFQFLDGAIKRRTTRSAE